MKRCMTIGMILVCSMAMAQITPEEKQKIDNAAPRTAFAAPKKPRKVLVTNLHTRDGRVVKGHNSIPFGNMALELMAAYTGAFEPVFSNDTLMFTSENLQQFDAVCFNNTAGVLFNSAKLRANLLEFVSSGKGLIGIHAAGATFVQWPRYDQWPAFGELLGGYENGGHPWKAHEWITLRVEEPGHPLTAMFRDKYFPVSDEVFQFQEPYSRDKLRILLVIDPEKTDMGEQRNILAQRRADKDLAISWIHEYGQGRVFYSSLGHNPHIYWDQAIMGHFLAGIQYALGDLPAEATPSNQLKSEK